ncbi:MAG: hypothetical protein DCC49_09765 [Acidobacteria bacterium]|nr:MAG: hypothetical protein DCC49_09765 [Acidobacteriota bacterium]
MNDIHELLSQPIDMDAVSAYLDGLTHLNRLGACREMTPKEQAALFDAAEGYQKITIDDFVSPDLDPLFPVIHWGKNSLPVFTTFQKRFTRPDDDAAKERGELWGFNRQRMEPFTGPGYFVAYGLDTGEVLVDYTKVPPRGAGGWPEVLPNTAKLSRFIYNGTQDTLRGVSNHVTIGRAARDGEWMPNWFVLCRQDP